jgi:hypothetical protein
MWALALPQVAATLAVALTAYQAKDAAGNGLIDEPILNSILVLVVVTSVLGPILTEVFGARMAAEKEKAASVTMPGGQSIGPDLSPATSRPTPKQPRVSPRKGRGEAGAGVDRAGPPES